MHDAIGLLREAHARFAPRLALVSSFGAESAVLLHMASRIDAGLPIIFLDTGKLFPETLAYRDRLVARLGLRDLRVAQPDPARIAMLDPRGGLWRDDPDLCCWNRKIEPLDGALAGFDAWITGRKRSHGGARSDLPAVERGPDGRTKFNPLASWNRGRSRAGTSSSTTCRRIRCPNAATARSAARPAPARRAPARTHAPAAGRAATRPSAASTCRAPTHRSCPHEQAIRH